MSLKRFTVLTWTKIVRASPADAKPAESVSIKIREVSPTSESYDGYSVKSVDVNVKNAGCKPCTLTVTVSPSLSM